MPRVWGAENTQGILGEEGALEGALLGMLGVPG